jgi:EmrB/QacA subfamily drug resistance transporter
MSSLPHSNKGDAAEPLPTSVPQNEKAAGDEAEENSEKGRDGPEALEEQQKSAKHSWQFWLVFAALCLISFISAIDATIVTVALPTITRAIGGEDQYVWIANSFLFAATATQPLFGQISNIFGRRNPMLVSIVLFALGSGIAAGAHNVAMLIGGRAVQGLGSGGLFVLLDLIVCDLVPLRERGQYLGFMLSTAAIGTVVGPIIGGGLATKNWRWIFWLNLPISGLALAAMFFFLKVKYNRDPTWKQSLRRVDWLGNAIFIASITSILLGLVTGGTMHPWSSFRVIVPIVLGFLGWILFHVHQASSLCKEPSVPPHLFKNRTSAVGFILGFTSSMLLEWVVYFLPLYFQAVLGASPVKAGVDFLPYTAFVVPFGIGAGILMSKSGTYKPLHWVGFALSAIGCGLLSLLKEGSSKAAWVCFQILAAGGTGIVMTAILPSTLAALPEKDVATATGTYSFLRNFGFVWGVTLPSIIFNARFNTHLNDISDLAVRDLLKNGAAYGYASGGYIKNLPNATRHEVIQVYVRALRAVWLAAMAFAVFSFLLVFLEKHVELRQELNTEFGLEEKKSENTAKSSEEGKTAV